jgi:transaldolase
MPTSSAIRRLAELHPDTEIWWDSSPLIFDAWRADCRRAWAGRPDLLAALEDLGGFESLARVFRGCTTNPPLALQAIQDNAAEWDAWIAAQAPRAASAHELLWNTYEEVLRRGAHRLAPLWDESGGRYGHICGQVDPRSLMNTGAMVAQGQWLHAVHPNVMIKMPGTREGIEGIRILSGMGISTNATLCFSVAQILAVAEAARDGFAAARAQGVDMTGARSVATMMLGRMEDAPPFAEQARELGIELSEVDRRWAGVAVARQTYRILRERGLETMLLMASMRMGPTVDGETQIWHLAQVAGGRTVMTIFPNILASFIETYAGRELEPTIEQPVPAEVLERLLRVPYFRQAYEPDGVAPEGFGDLPGVRITGASFAESMQTLADHVQGIWAQAHGG